MSVGPHLGRCRISNGYMGGFGGVFEPGLLWGYRQALRYPRTTRTEGYA
jgi:hypothetical protein